MILLIVILLVNLNSISEASNELAVQDIKELAVQPDEKYEKDNFPIVEPVSSILAEADCPEAVSADEIKKGGHVQRLYEQEKDLNTIVFQNDDGSKTLYYFAEPVKYVDEDGNVRDKSNTLTEVADTSYPVTVDPSFDIVSANNGIMDIYVNQSGTTLKEDYLFVGSTCS